MLVVGLKEVTTTKEVIQTLEQLLCDETSQLVDERNEVMHSRDTFQDLVRLMDQHRVERTVQLSILRQGDDQVQKLHLVQVFTIHHDLPSRISCPAAFICPNQITLFTFSFLKWSGSIPLCSVIQDDSQTLYDMI